MDKNKVNAGVIEDRGITDCLWAFVYVQFLNLMCVSLAWTILNGDTKRVFAPVSFVDKHDLGEWTLLSRPDGIKKDAVHYCGVDRGFKDYKWLYFTNFNTGDPSTIMDTGICVSHCPFHKAKVDDLVYITYGGIDSLDVPVDEKVAKLDKTLNFTLNNPNGAYKSSEFGPLHLCMPDIEEFKSTHPEKFYTVQNMMKELSQSDIGKYIYDLWLSSTSIFYSFATSVVWSLVFIYFLSLFAQYFAWAIVIVV